jgi:hypothetical protein
MSNNNQVNLTSNYNGGQVAPGYESTSTGVSICCAIVQLTDSNLGFSPRGI